VPNITPAIERTWFFKSNGISVVGRSHNPDTKLILRDLCDLLFEEHQFWLHQTASELITGARLCASSSLLACSRFMRL
jgi:hypothetical protein